MRPLPPGAVDYPAATYRYGSTRSGTLRPHHGIDFENPQGTLVLAAGRGAVVFADNDRADQLGPTTSFYGNVVVVQLHQAYLYQPVYVLYGHLATITVRRGDWVEAGAQLGTVGGTGIARGGTHLHCNCGEVAIQHINRLVKVGLMQLHDDNIAVEACGRPELVGTIIARKDYSTAPGSQH